ncbi:helix-turn-helix transcriptional regulator [Cytobacillus sp. Sa5YUA1]|uniref:Helix-turn-helix transcriptional regulator n=1 Tax=Cytobacillus stercorigallinarum TaxID=2762240 RepID=A0ABR8QV96_9BACI|nr:helix-turn-helix transcriptional regulator [Cytobacillus stercorigallinarum]MBD7939466.1 helix-turn-helix transcriptional regulator [Cytobacillus stercorigallinarum]
MNRIKEIRKQKGFKQKDISFITGLNVTTISNYETGYRKPSMNAAYKIAKALGVTVNDLFIIEIDETIEQKAKAMTLNKERGECRC